MQDVIIIDTRIFGTIKVILVEEKSKTKTKINRTIILQDLNTWN
jgi:hypothetical protein